MLKDFSPHEAHAHEAFFGWIVPTMKVSEYTVLQIVGLDAAVLLSFFKTSFYLFSVCSLCAVTVLMPINWKNNIGVGGGTDEDDNDCRDWSPPVLTTTLWHPDGSGSTLSAMLIRI
jgi:hypothetical protein